jgi:hypothetical protein
MKYKSICRGVEYTIFGQGKVFDEISSPSLSSATSTTNIFGDVTGLDLDCDISCRLIEKTTLFDPGGTLFIEDLDGDLDLDLMSFQDMIEVDVTEALA